MELPSDQDRLGSIYAVPLMLFFVAVLLFVALLQGQQPLTALCLITIAVFSCAFMWSRVSLRATRFDLAAAHTSLFPDEELPLTLEVINDKALPIHLAVRPGISGALIAAGDKPLAWQTGGLLGYQKATFRWTLTAIRRGVHTVGPTVAASGDPFGFFPRQTRIPGQREILVYPRLVPLRPVPLPRRDAFGAPGARSHVRDPVHILGTRDYQPPEPARHIHWKASARCGRLQTKVIAPSQQEKTLLLLDAAGFADQSADEAFEGVLEVIAGMAVQKDRQGLATGFATNALIRAPGRSALAPARNPRQIALILETLARTVKTSTGDLLNVVRGGLQLSHGTSCVVFTFALDRKAEMLLAFLLRRGIPVKAFTWEASLALRDDSAQR